MRNFKKARTEFCSAIDALYDALRELINKNGGFVDTQNFNGELDTIYAIDCTDDTYECNILAIRVVDDKIQYVSEYGYCTKYTKKELENMYWTDLKGGDNYYISTLDNICQSIEEYIKVK